MKLRTAVIFLALVLVAAAPSPGRRLMIAQYQGPGGNRIIELDADGKIAWEHQVPSLCVIFQRLPDGHVVYA